MTSPEHPTPADRLRAVRALFDAAIALPEADREAYLAHADPGLRDEVRRLLAAASSGDAIFEAGPTAAKKREEFFSHLRQAIEGRYSIERELGHGGMATVFLAQDVRHHRPVALKVLHPEIASGVGQDRFEREVRFAARLQHPHIVPVHESGNAPGRPGEPTVLWYTMPYVDGESLRDRLRRETQLPLPDALRITREVADALDYAHKQRVIHRDIKPENILLSSGHALVADFGIARAVSEDEGTTRTELTGTGAAIGTVAYMSPEQSSGDQRVDPRTDQYSLACVLYEMLAGEPPFTGPTAQMIVTRRFTEEPRPLRASRTGVPAHVERAVTTALARVPADRHATTGAFADALEAAPAESETPVAPKPLWRSRPILAGAAVLLLGMAFLLWKLVGPGGPPPGPPHLAVLPFENLGDSADVYFAEGVVDDIRLKLVGLGFQVPGRASTSPYRGTSKPLRQVAEELGVQYLLTGTILWTRSSGTQRVQVRPQLLELVPDGPPLTRWGAPFDAPITDVFQLQGNIAGQVAAALSVTISPAVAPTLREAQTTNLAAWDEFLRGEQEYFQSSGLTSMQKAHGFYERAIALDSAFARAWGRLAQVNSSIAVFTGSVEDQAAADSVSAKAMTLAPGLPEAHLARGHYFTLVRNDYPRAIEALEAGLALSPNHAELLGALGLAEQGLGHFDRAIDYMRRGLAVDPRSLLHVRRLTRALTWLHRFPEAEVEARRALALRPSDASAIQYAALVQLTKGDLAAAQAYFRSIPADADSLNTLGYWAENEVINTWAIPEAQRRFILQLPAAPFGDRGSEFASKAMVAYGLGDQLRSRAYADSALVGVTGDGWPMMQALAGRPIDRFREGLRRQEAEVERLANDMFEGPRTRHNFILACLFAGEYDRALTHLEAIVRVPYYLTPAWLMIDKTFDPVRQDPRFQRLLAGR